LFKLVLLLDLISQYKTYIFILSHLITKIILKSIEIDRTKSKVVSMFHDLFQNKKEQKLYRYSKN